MAWSNIHTTTTLANLNPDIWVNQVEPYAEALLVSEGIVTKFDFAGAGDVLRLPKMSAISCNAAITDGSDVTLTGNTEAVVTVTPAGRECAVFIPWQVGLVSLQATEGAYQIELARAIRTDKDYRILTQTASLTTNIVGSGSSHVEKTVFLEALRKVRGGNAKPPYNAVFSTDEFDVFFSISDFVDASKTGSVDRIQNGLGGMLIGTNVWFTSNVYIDGATNYNLICGDRCLAYAAKLGLTIDINTVPIKGNGILIHGKYMDASAILNDAFGCCYQTANV